MAADVTARNRRNKRAGTDWETLLLRELRNEGFDVERLRLAGAEDEGDLVVRGGVRHRPIIDIEAKSGKLEPALFVREAVTEARNYERHRGLQPYTALGIAIAKQRGKNWKDAYVLTTVRELFGLGDG